jgi:hypothetical protein
MNYNLEQIELYTRSSWSCIAEIAFLVKREQYVKKSSLTTSVKPKTVNKRVHNQEGFML